MSMPKNHNPDKGLIFNIQRFSIHDGPGIRTTVFMKGCPLRCRWCSNPESQDFSPNLMARNINCQACGACVDACPEGAITLDPEGGRRIHWEDCNQCLECVNACMYDSLKQCGQEMTVKEVLEEVLRDEAFYKNSGGGMTVSGGEALSQSEFVADLLRAAKDAGLHTALDTTGYAPWDRMERTIPFVDLILWDIKHLDSRKHKWGTGQENEVILENLKKASDLSKPIWLRMPLIRDYNDSEAHIRKVIALGKEIRAEKISLLPYHEGGKTKCEQMGREYPFPEGKSPADEEIEHLKGIIEREGLKVMVGS